MPVGDIDYGLKLVPIYENLFGRAQALLKRFNPCNVCDGVCERFRRGQGKNFCCEGCPYLGPEGCRVKALRCALWVCREDLVHPDNRRAFTTEMWNITLVADQFKLLVSRGSMEDSIARAVTYWADNRHLRAVLESKIEEFVPAPLFFGNALLVKPSAQEGAIFKSPAKYTFRAEEPMKKIKETPIGGFMKEVRDFMHKPAELHKPELHGFAELRTSELKASTTAVASEASSDFPESGVGDGSL